MWYKSPYPWVMAAAAAAILFAVGRFLPLPVAPPQALRLGGYSFIDPLLACNVNNSRVFPEDRSLSDDIQSIIDSHVRSGDLSKASTYFVDLANGKWSDVYQDEKYYPASLGKIPIMMAYYEMAESDPAILDKEITYADGNPDLNQMQDIKPAEAVAPGKTYTVEQLIEYMIKYSDNNAATLLFNAVDHDALNNIYDELNIPTLPVVTKDDADVVAPQQIAELFRVLYNATYISRDYSETALRLMSESSFTQGLIAGVPSSTVVSHKLGLTGFDSGGIVTEHELHDCGIIYARDPYILCVMTRGSSSLSVMESVIADISGIVYGHVESGK